MALIKATNNPYDGTAENAYWKIVETNINWLTESSHVTMLGYLDQQARIDGKQPIVSRSYDWSGQDNFPFDIITLDKENNNCLKIAYEKIKSLQSTNENGDIVYGEFHDAQDC